MSRWRGLEGLKPRKEGTFFGLVVSTILGLQPCDWDDDVDDDDDDDDVQ